MDVLHINIFMFSFTPFSLQAHSLSQNPERDENNNHKHPNFSSMPFMLPFSEIDAIWKCYTDIPGTKKASPTEFVNNSEEGKLFLSRMRRLQKNEIPQWEQNPRFKLLVTELSSTL